MLLIPCWKTEKMFWSILKQTFFFFLDKYPEFRDTGIYTLSLLTREGRMGILKKKANNGDAKFHPFNGSPGGDNQLVKNTSGEIDIGKIYIFAISKICTKLEAVESGSSSQRQI